MGKTFILLSALSNNNQTKSCGKLAGLEYLPVTGTQAP
jgi:hypothetical protein